MVYMYIKNIKKHWKSIFTGLLELITSFCWDSWADSSLPLETQMVGIKEKNLAYDILNNATITMDRLISSTSWMTSPTILRFAKAASYTGALLWVQGKVRQPSALYSWEKHERTRPHTHRIHLGGHICLSFEHGYSTLPHFPYPSELDSPPSDHQATLCMRASDAVRMCVCVRVWVEIWSCRHRRRRLLEEQQQGLMHTSVSG